MSDLNALFITVKNNSYGTMILYDMLQEMREKIIPKLEIDGEDEYDFMVNQGIIVEPDEYEPNNDDFCNAINKRWNFLLDEFKKYLKNITLQSGKSSIVFFSRNSAGCLDMIHVIKLERKEENTSGTIILELPKERTITDI